MPRALAATLVSLALASCAVEGAAVSGGRAGLNERAAGRTAGGVPKSSGDASADPLSETSSASTVEVRSRRAAAAATRAAIRPAAAAEPSIYSFVDVTAAEGIVLDPRRSWGSTWVDHDRDGDPDLLANRHFLVPYYFEQTADGYREASWQDVLRVRKFDRHACLWGDPNSDGLPDLLCAQGAERGEGSGPNQLLLQDAGGGFRRRPGALGLGYAQGRSRTINWVDYDGDGDLDLFIGTQYRKGYPNRMFRNDKGTFRRARVGLGHALRTEVSAWADWDRDGDLDLLLTLKGRRAVAYENRKGRFRRVRLPRVTTTDWLGASFGDLNGDRWPDLHLINGRRSLILRNRKGRFEPVYRMWSSRGRTGIWFDADNDGDQDLFLIRGAPGNGDDPDAVDLPDILLIQKNGWFKEQLVPQSGSEQGNGDSVAVSDHDRDGSLDLFVTNGYKRTAGPFVLLENRSTIQNWAAVRLRGGRGDPFGMWAVLKVTTAQGTFWRHLSDGLVFRSQSEVGYTHLGLGPAERARVEVRWFRGGRDCVRVKAGQVIELRRGSAPCR